MKSLDLLLLSAFLTVIANAAPTITCPAPATVLCNASTEVTVFVSNSQADTVGVVWSVNGTSTQTNLIPANQSVAGTNVAFLGDFAFGTNVVDVTATDTAGNTVACSTTVTVIDTNPPVITLVRAAPPVLWPPNHKMRTISVHVEVTDDCSATTWKIISVSSNEADDVAGSGNTSPDWQIIGDHALKLRAERAGQGSGREYTITVQAVDSAGNLSEPATTPVTVPHDQGHLGHGHGPKPKPHGKGNGKG